MALVETGVRGSVQVRQENVVNSMAAVVVPGVAGIIGGAVATVPSHELGHAVNKYCLFAGKWRWVGRE